MAAPEETPGPTAVESTAGAFGRMVQGWVLEQFTVGVVLMALVAVSAGFLEASGTVRGAVVVAGALVVVVTLVGWRRHWRDAVMWPAMLVCGAVAVAAFVYALGG